MEDAFSRREWTNHSYGSTTASRLISGHRGLRKECFREVELKMIAWLFKDLDEFVSYANSAKPQATTDKATKRSAHEREEKVLSAIATGATFYAIGKSCGVTPLYPKLLLHRLERPLPIGTKPIDMKRLDVILDRLKQGLPFRNIARSLNVPYDEIIAVSMAYPTQVEHGRKARLAQRLEIARQEITSLLATRKIQTRSEARKCVPTHVELLYEYDKAWLNNMLPISTPVRVFKPDHGKQVNWVALDCQIAERLRIAYAAVKADPLHPRISLARLSRAIGFRNTWLHRHSKRLPNSAALISEYVESGASGRYRRLQAAQKILESEGGPASRSSVRNLARLGGGQSHSRA